MNNETRKGGRGKCKFCGEFENNVSYHEAWECSKRIVKAYGNLRKVISATVSFNGDLTHAMVSIQTDGGGIVLVDPTQTSDYPKDGDDGL